MISSIRGLWLIMGSFDFLDEFSDPSVCKPDTPERMDQDPRHIGILILQYV